MERERASSTFELISFWEIQRRVISGGCYDLFLCRLSLRSVQVSNLSLGHVVMMIQTATTVKMDIMKRMVKKMIFIMMMFNVMTMKKRMIVLMMMINVREG